MSVVAELESPPVETPASEMEAVIRGHSEKKEWKCRAELTSYSATGSSFQSTRECKAGTLVYLEVPLPAYLRCYDHDQELYSIWGLVQYSQKVEEKKGTSYHVGVAFIGKEPPAEYEAEPTQRFTICGMNGDGLWKIRPEPGEFTVRKEIRYWSNFELYLSQVNAERRAVNGARAVTENISKSGAAVVSSLDVNVGDRVKFISTQFDFSGLAVVCERKDLGEDRAKIHLKFIENSFPIEKVYGRSEQH
ncbi:MAG TPA: PilZ domain-containing protein [Pyrinomonadaceae bacterium]|nr:PilZ domain-containing protein [Pyrinomonadaceae bacterium]